MSRRLAILVAVSLAMLAPAPARAEEPMFPLMAWGHTPGDPAVLKKMRECGITVAGFVAPSALDACRDAGLKAIVSDPRTSSYDWMNAYFVMPYIPDAAIRFSVIWGMFDGVLGASQAENGYVTETYESELIAAIVAYCRTFLPDVLPLRPPED